MRLFGSVLLVLTIVFPNIARQSGAVLNGTVVDDAGMGVGGVEVELEFVQTGETVTVLTDVLGNYVFEGLPPGVYRLGTDPPDSIPLRIENIDVGPNDTRTFRMTAMPPREPDEEGDLSIRAPSSLPEAALQCRAPA
jgi:hypothetical protein